MIFGSLACRDSAGQQPLSDLAHALHRSASQLRPGPTGLGGLIEETKGMSNVS